MFERELEEFAYLCKMYILKPSKRLDRKIRDKYMSIYYLIRAFEDIYDLNEIKDRLKEIVICYGIK